MSHPVHTVANHTVAKITVARPSGETPAPYAPHFPPPTEFMQRRLPPLEHKSVERALSNLRDDSSPYKQMHALVDLVEFACAHDPQLVLQLNSAVNSIADLINSSKDPNVVYLAVISANRIGSDSVLASQVTLEQKRLLHTALCDIGVRNDYALTKLAEVASLGFDPYLNPK